KLGLQRYLEFIHFGLTSQDINNTAIPYTWKAALQNSYLVTLDELTQELEQLVAQWKEIPMLARTHGQPASPTRLGKEIQVCIERMRKQKDSRLQLPHSANSGAATGDLKPHHIASPTHVRVAFANDFVNPKLGLDRSQTTTQIEHYDNFAASCDNLKRINNIRIDLCRDIWTYISIYYFKQKITAVQIGSSAMPHKVNQIGIEA